MWLEEGNLVLVASDAMAFYSHRSVISRKSAVLNDMFSFPQLENSETRPGCAVMHVSDAPEDVFIFLDAIYNGGK
jgi:hypothetical protein